MKLIQRKSINAILRPRKASSHKGDYGHALLIAGSQGLMGAACIASLACLRSGVGLLTVDIPKNESLILQISVPEAMVRDRESLIVDSQAYSAIGIGPGLGTKADSKKMLLEVLSKSNQPLLIDADALNLLSTDKKLLKKIPPFCILTPHPKEFDRLFGAHDSVDKRMEKAIQMAKDLGCVVVLKGHETLVTFNGEAYLNSTGNAGLAKGGSGDCLSGMITAFIAQKYHPFDAAKIGVYLHGLAADLALKNQSVESMLITDVIDCIGEAFKKTMK